jgi:diadenosine tetraphosphatase ApaH/serine/threonine PP2A family protein phosphatase
MSKSSQLLKSLSLTYQIWKTNILKLHIVIGDVHGCLQELQALWQKLPLDKAQEIIFLGDLIDKGPQSTAVLDFVLAMQEQYPIVLIQGNHELKALKRAAKNLSLEFEPSQARLRLIESALPYYPFAEGKYLAVHAGIYPAFWEHCTQLPLLDTQSDWPRKLQDRIQRFGICRYVNPAGNIVALGSETEADVFWAERYLGQAGTIFFGHQPYLTGVQNFAHALGMDTGCVFGGQLTAALVSDSGQINWLQEPARQAYAENWFQSDED